MVDVVCAKTPSPGERMHGGVSVRAGGSAVNAATHAARSGAAATVVGRVGNDPAGHLVAAFLVAHGVETRLARDAELATGATVALGTGDDMSVIADRGANARLSPADVPQPLEGNVLLVSGFALFQPGSAEAARAALERFAGEWTAVDLASPRLAEGANLDVEATGASVVFATAEEAKAVTGAEPEEAARLLASRFQVACVKLGEEGALAADRHGLERVPVAPVLRRFPFGAGDAFAASFLLALASGASVASALARACEAGARAAAG
jgi:sugar/nucleoside kinase (ribokinase family)